MLEHLQWELLNELFNKKILFWCARCDFELLKIGESCLYKQLLLMSCLTLY